MKSNRFAVVFKVQSSVISAGVKDLWRTGHDFYYLNKNTHGFGANYIF